MKSKPISYDDLCWNEANRNKNARFFLVICTGAKCKWIVVSCWRTLWHFHENTAISFQLNYSMCTSSKWLHSMHSMCAAASVRSCLLSICAMTYSKQLISKVVNNAVRIVQIKFTIRNHHNQNTFLCSVEKWKSVKNTEKIEIDRQAGEQASNARKNESKTSNLNEVMSSQVQINDVKKFWDALYSDIAANWNETE